MVRSVAERREQHKLERGKDRPDRMQRALVRAQGHCRQCDITAVRVAAAPWTGEGQALNLGQLGDGIIDRITGKDRLNVAVGHIVEDMAGASASRCSVSWMQVNLAVRTPVDSGDRGPEV